MMKNKKNEEYPILKLKLHFILLFPVPMYLYYYTYKVRIIIEYQIVPKKKGIKKRKKNFFFFFFIISYKEVRSPYISSTVPGIIIQVQVPRSPCSSA